MDIMAKNLPVKDMKVLTVQGAESSLDDNNHPVSFQDREDPFCLYHITNSGHIKATLDNDRVNEMLMMEEHNLRKKVKPSPTINRLRITFWMEYQRAMDQRCKMVLQNVYRGVCSYEYFQKIFYDIKHLHNAVWILKPRQNYAVVMNEALDTANMRLREILEMPIYDLVDDPKSKSGRKKRIPNTKTAELILKAQKVLDERVKGAIVQKATAPSNAVNINVNNSSQKDERGIVEVHGADIVDAKIVEEEIRRLEADNLRRSNVEVKDIDESEKDGTVPTTSGTSEETES